MLRAVLRTLLNPRVALSSGSPRHSTPAAQNARRTEAPALPRSGLRLHHFTHNFPLLLGGGVLLILFIATVFGPLWMPYDPFLNGLSVIPHFDRETMTYIRPPFDPSWQYLLGTDRWGNDLLSLIVYGARMTLVTAAYIMLARLALGAVLGSIAGWYANRLPDRIISTLIAVLTSLPALVAALLLIVALGPQNGLPVFLTVLTFIGWTEVAQYVRGEMMVLARQGYVEGAHATGLSSLQIIVRHIWPNLLPHLLVLAFLEMGTVLILLAELGFLGVFLGGNSTIQLDIALGGEPPPVYIIPENPEWGAMVAQGAAFIRSAPYILLAPAGAFLLTVLGLNAFGEGLRRLLDYTSVSTAFLLRKQMLLLLALFVTATALLLSYTGPRRSYARLAQSFDGARALVEAQRLAQFNNQSAAAFYIAGKLEEYGFEPGFPEDFGKAYLDTYQAQKIQLSAEPTLAVLDDRWRPAQTFTHGESFGYMLEGPAGAGEVVAPVTLLHFHPDDPTALRLGFQNVPINERIVMLSSAPPEYINLALNRGARGVLVISDSVVSQPYVADRESRGLVFFVDRQTASAIAAQGGNDLEALLAGTDEGATRVYGSLGVTVHMALQTSGPQTIELPVALGFLPGYDQRLAAEVVLLLAPFGDQNSSGVADFTEAAALLEIARSWHEHNVGPRRSLMLVAWGGEAGLATGYLQGTLAYDELVARVPTGALQPVALLHYESSQGQGPWLAPTGDAALRDLFELALLESGLQAVSGAPPAVNSPLFGFDARYVYLHWGSAPTADDPAAAIQQLGQVLNHTLIRVTREEDWQKLRQDFSSDASND